MAKWQPGVGKAVLKGELQPGTEFHWTGQGLPIVSTFLEVAAPQRVSWKGKAIGIQAIHIWILEEKDGETVVTTEESWSGWLARIFKLFSSAMLDTAVAESLHTLKQQAETQHQQR